MPDARTSPIWRKYVVRIAVLLVMCVGTAVVVERIAVLDTVRDRQIDSLRDLGDLRTNLEKRVNGDFQRLRGLVGLVGSGAVITQDRFAKVAAHLVEGQLSEIINIGLAPDLVVRFVYPLKGNESVLGLDYRVSTTQGPMVEKAVQSHDIIIAGPLDLIQGGRGLIARYPLFEGDDSSAGKERLWGIVSMAVDFDKFVARAGYDSLAERYDLALYGIDGKGRDGGLIMGSPSDLVDPVSITVSLPVGHWVIDASPKGGWPVLSRYFWMIVGGTVLIFLVGSVLIVIGARFEIAMMRANLMMYTARSEALDARDEAQRSNQAKTLFLANMSHELRTPLNAIIGFSQLMSEGLFGRLENERYRVYVEDILLSSRHLLALISDILDISRIESGEMQIYDEVIHIRQLIDDSVRLVGQRGRNDCCSVKTDIPEDNPAIRVDGRMMRQSLMNVIGNAIKFSPVGGTVTVSVVHLDYGGLAILVEDHGAGIPEEDIERITEPFIQLRPGSDVAAKGAGLGLAISKRILEAHEGSLRIVSSIGEGTTVFLEIPAMRVVKTTP